MVLVRFIKKNDNLVSVQLSGHANSVDQGYDMVCTAVSAISLTVANGITEVLKVNPYIKENDGFLSIDLTSCSKEDINRCKVLMDTMLLGLRSVEYNYGKYIKVKVEEV
ncbi:ribosomal-processing cysteine protease Prp [Clostridium oceanicum]|uniref:Ribosomal processing cysteine protease Prp n=1 Tax=Clostridium oceanicum TaxID=1543 RepID=A0ABN1JVK9_9CLOT